MVIIKNMDQRSRVIVIGAIALLVVAAVLAAVVLIGRAAKNKTPRLNDNPDVSLNDLQVVPPTPSGQPEVINPSETKTYLGKSWVLKYPKNWGVLTCNNSQNIELDPSNGTDIRGSVCDYALKPVTIIEVAKQNCQGDQVTLGTNKVTKLKTPSQNGDIKYRWCLTVGGKNLEISHRVSQSGARATSKEDFSSQIEEMIKSLQITSQGS